MADSTIKHQGVVEEIADTHRMKVRILQTSACASCSIKGHCTSADTKEKLIDAVVADTSVYRVGDAVWVVGRLAMGVMAVLYAFILPFLVLVTALFAGMSVWNDELLSALCALGFLVPYCYVVWLNRERMSRKFSFSVQPMTDELIHNK